MNRIGILAMLLILAASLPAAQTTRSLRADPEQPPAHLVLERLSRMSPEEKQKLLASLPPQRRAVIEQRLERYAQLPAATKERLREEYNQFLQLPPDQQNEVRTIFKRFSELPEDRRKVVRRELYRLRRMPKRKAATRINSEPFRVEFSDSERQMLERLTALLSSEPPAPAPSR